MRALAGRILLSTAGRQRWQPAYRWAHERALRGRNYGRSAVGESGERHALAYAHDRLPDAGVLLDVGANRGTWSLEARGLWPTAQIHAFEPSRRVHGELVAATAGRGITCVRAACGDEPGTADLYAVDGLDELSSLHQRDLASHGMSMTAVETVDVTTVDAYCAGQGIERVDYLKVDAEGHDLAVLQGAAGVLEVGVRFVQFEFGGGNIDSRTFVRDFVRLLEPRYRVSRMLTDGLEPVEYSERDEVFLTTNFLAELV